MGDRIMIDLGALVVSAEAVAITIKRKTAGAYDAAGKWIPGAPVEEAATAEVHPATGRKLLDLPEGVREEAEYFLWSQSALALGDVVSYGGSDYRVILTQPRPEGGFTKAVLGKLKQ